MCYKNKLYNNKELLDQLDDHANIYLYLSWHTLQTRSFSVYIILKSEIIKSIFIAF